MTASPPPAGASVGEHGDRFVCATAGPHRLAFPIAAVQEVLAPRAVTRLFHAPASLLGVVNLRGEILPVVDLMLLLDGGRGRTPRAVFEPEARLIVLRARLSPEDGAHRNSSHVRDKLSSLAVLVSQLDPLRDGAVAPLPAGVPDDIARLALGIVTGGSHAVVVIDARKLVDVEELARMRA